MMKTKEFVVSFQEGNYVDLQLIKVVDGIARYECTFSATEDCERKVTLRITVEESQLSAKEKLFLRFIGPK